MARAVTHSDRKFERLIAACDHFIVAALPQRSKQRRLHRLDRTGFAWRTSR
jgi:hypothetical protein